MIIYQIKNIVNQKIYIGSALNYKRRKYNHTYLLRKGSHPNTILQNSYNKYGEENFLFEIVEECTKENLLVREQHYIDTLKPLMNVRLIAESNLGHRFIRTDEQKEKYKEAHRNISPETRDRMKSYKHMLGKKHQSSTKKLMAQKKERAIMQYNLDMTKVKEWKSALDVERALNYNHSVISLCCNGKRKTGYKFIWKFKT